jgi:hypothetical protein
MHGHTGRFLWCSIGRLIKRRSLTPQPTLNGPSTISLYRCLMILIASSLLAWSILDAAHRSSCTGTT